MATNPMQRKARNSFLLGMLLMLVIAGIVIAFLFIIMMRQNQQQEEELGQLVNAYVLNQDVSAGQVITSDMYSLQQVNSNLVPSNATSNLTVIQSYSLQDKDGNEVRTQAGQNGQPILYVEIDGEQFQVQQAADQSYYYERNGTQVDLTSVPLIAKVNMRKNTLLTADLVAKGSNSLQDDVRKQEYNMIVLPIDLATGDYVDVRLMLPSGQDYIVVSKKEVTLPDTGTDATANTVWMNLSEDEILHLSCAIVDACKITGSKLYITKYTDPGIQEAAQVTYPVNRDTFALIQSDPNIVQRAMEELNNRYNNSGTTLRNDYIEPAISNEGDEAQSNVESGMEESITNSQEARQDYLESLQAAPATTTTTTDTTSTTNTATTTN